MANSTDEQKEETSIGSDSQLGNLNYQFFEHVPFAVDYEFSAPLLATAVPSTESASGYDLSGQSSSIRTVTDAHGAVITYPLWQLFPAAVTYSEGTKVRFEYDADGDVVRVVWQSGKAKETEKEYDWLRGKPFDNEFHHWRLGDGSLRVMRVIVFPDGSITAAERGDVVTIYSTDGKCLVSRGFKPNFDLRQSLVRVLKRLDKGGDGLLSKEELNLGVSQVWEEENDAQLVAMLKMHFECIQLGREHAVFKIGQGLTAQDIIQYDSVMRKKLNQNPPKDTVDAVEALFDAVDLDGDQNVSLAEIEQNYLRHKLSAAQKCTLNYIVNHKARLNVYTKQGYVDRTQRLTKSEFLAHFSEVYADQVGKYANRGGWGIEKVWSDKAISERKLYADLNKPEESVKVEAIKQGRVGDCLFLAALGSLISVRPEAVPPLIVDNDNGTYTVTFAGAQDTPVLLTAPTSTELALYARASEYGIWAPLLEKAYGTLVAQLRGTTAVIPAEHTAGWEKIYAFTYLTGHPYRIEYTQDHLLLRRTISFTQFRNLILNCFRERRAIIAASYTGWDAEGEEPVICPFHAYSVLEYDVGRDLLIFRNPWGIVPKGALKRQDLLPLGIGKPLTDDGTDGIFALSLANAYKKFGAWHAEIA